MVVGDRPILERPHVPPGPDRLPRLHIRSLAIPAAGRGLPAGGYRSGVSQSTPNGGRAIDAEAGRPCQGFGTALTTPRLPTPLPP